MAANERLRRLMQEALDDVLTPEEREELVLHLDEDDATFSEYSRLKRVDDTLRTSPHERAPQRLAATIMARLGQSIQAEAEAQARQVQQSEAELQITAEVVSVAVSLVTVVTTPLLVAAAWMILNSAADPRVLERVFAQIIAVAMLVIEILQVLLERIEAQLQSDPDAAMATLALIPVVMLAIARYVLGDELVDAAIADAAAQRAASD